MSAAVRTATIVATLVAFCVSLIPVTSVAASSPGVPAITSVTGDLTTLTVVWSAPTEDGGSTITSYDVRYIRSGAAASATDGDWTEVDDAWTSGSLTYQLTDLRRDTGYDVALRAESTDGESEWSDATTASTTDHGDSIADAATLELGSTIEGSIDSTDDADYFRIVVSSRTDLWVYASGALDTTGYLLNSNGTLLTKNQDSAYVDFPRAFSIRREVNSGTYYIKVESRGQLLTGTYAIYVQAARNPGSTPSSAERVELNSMTPGRLSFPGGDRGALDYFSFHLDRSTDVWALGVGNVDTVAELRNSRGARIAGNDDSLWPKNELSFLLRARLDPGTYYLKVMGYVRKDTGPYTLELREAIVAGGSQTEATPMSLDTPQTGYLSSITDTDHFQFSIKDDTYVVIKILSYGRQLPVTISGTGITSLVDAYSKPHSSLGKISYWTWGKLAAGDYNIAVSLTASDAGWYMIFITTDRYGEVLDTCQAITTSVDDPLYGCQWHLNNTGQFPNGAMQDIGVEDVWDDTDPTTMGEGVNVAVVDSGLDADHADLSPNVTAARNHNYNTGTTDISGSRETHGTAVAGIIAARDNSVGVRGVAPRATIYGYNLLGPGVSTSANVGDAMTRNMADTAVYNNSWGYRPFGHGNPAYAEGTWEKAVVNGVTNGYVINGDPKGVSYIFSAGNGHSYGGLSNINGYRNHYAVTTVCAVNYNDERSSYSEQGANLWVCGPSSDRGAIHDLASITTLRNNDRYRDDFGGTSAAAPIVSGVVALMRAANQELTWRDVKLILAESARKNDPANPGWRTGAERYGSEGNYEFNYQYGFGVVNAKAAVDLAESWANLPPMRARKAYSTDAAQPIPAASYSYVPGATIESTLTMDDYVDFIEFVQIEVDFQQKFFRDVDIELISPSGKSSMLTTAGFVKYAIAFNGNFRFGSALHLGEDAAGVWKLRVTNRLGQQAGTLRGWRVTVYGHGLTPGLLTVSTATPGAGSLDVAWTAPAAVAGETLSAVTSYDLRYIRADATDKSEPRWTPVNSLSASGTLQHKLDNLDALTEHQIQVRARNDAGPGPWSQVFKATTFDDPPSVPRNISIVPGNAALAISWQEPIAPGGRATSYDVRHIESDATGKDDPTKWTEHLDAWTDGGGDLLFSIPNLTSGEQYDVHVRGVNDGGDGEWSSTTTGTPVLRNSQPEFSSSGDYTRSVDENTRTGMPIGDPVVANDEDSDTLTYSLGSGAAFFDIATATGQLLTESALDREGRSSYTVTVLVSDHKNLTFEADTVIDDTVTVTIAVNDVDEPPTISRPRTRTFQENSDSRVAAYTATDPDGEPISGWDLEGVDSDKFEISNGELSFIESPNFEARADSDGNNVYEVTVIARAGALNGRRDVTITVTDVNEPPDALADGLFRFDEDTEITIEVLNNDSDPEDERSELLLTVVTPPRNGRATVNEPENPGDNRTITYKPNANYNSDDSNDSPDSFTYRVTDSGGLTSNLATVEVTIDPVNDAPEFPAATAQRSVSEEAQPGDPVGAPVTAMDIDDDTDTLTYRLADSTSFEMLDGTAQIAVSDSAVLNATNQPTTVTVTVADEDGATASIAVTITVTTGPVIPPVVIPPVVIPPVVIPPVVIPPVVIPPVVIPPVVIPPPGGGGGGGGGGFAGGGGGGGRSPSMVDFEWNVTRDIEDLDSAHDKPSGHWSDGTTLWILENGDGADDAVYAYDLATGERVEGREFELDNTNRAPRGVWSDRTLLWVSDSGRNSLFAHDLEAGERLPERDIALAARNRAARGIWSADGTMWVLDGGKDSIFAYDLASGALLAEYVLNDDNGDPHGIWSDETTVWVSDHGAKRLFAYRLPPAPDAPAAEDAERQDLERVRDEEFPNTVLSRASNNSPRGLWSDGDVMYVVDASDGKVYTYNMPDAIDARLASLSLSGVDIGEFSPNREDYEGIVDDGVTVTTVEAAAAQDDAAVVIDPADSDEAAEGRQVAVGDGAEITVTVTSADGSRTKTYRVAVADAGPSATCLRGAIAEGFSLVVSEGGSIEDLVACAEGRAVTALYTLDGGEYVSYILGAPGLVNEGFVALLADGLPALTPLIAKSEGPPSPAPESDAVPEFGPDCLRGAIVEGFNLVLHEGGSIDDIEACADEVGVAALYVLADGVWLSYILGAPEPVNAAFRELFTDGLPVATPLVGKRN